MNSQTTNYIVNFLIKNNNMKWYWFIPLVGIFFVEEFAEYFTSIHVNQNKYTIIFVLCLLLHISTMISSVYIFIL